MAFDDNRIPMEFLEVINSIIDDRLAGLDKVEICQIVSDDDGSGTYDIKLLSDEETVIRDVVNCTDFSFTNGEYAYIIKIKNKLSNSIIIGSNSPKITSKR